jgi:predicted O-methyltransferase YrrM
VKNYKEIDGWFNYENVFNFLIDKCPNSGVFIECGAWLGKSSSYLCDKNSKNLQIYIVDTWAGAANELNSTQALVKQTDIYNIFLNNMGKRNFIAIKEDGVKASKTFADKSCDVVFIDMEHTYNAVKNDINAWLPKVKTGGYIAGHDYTNLWQGVVDAVNETFDKNSIIVMGDCWLHKVEK